jgi:hypothetical protein
MSACDVTQSPISSLSQIFTINGFTIQVEPTGVQDVSIKIIEITAKDTDGAEAKKTFIL